MSVGKSVVYMIAVLNAWIMRETYAAKVAGNEANLKKLESQPMIDDLQQGRICCWLGFFVRAAKMVDDWSLPRELRNKNGAEPVARYRTVKP